jgi:hypothetical protein
MPRQSSLGVLCVLGGESCFRSHSPTKKIDRRLRMSFLAFAGVKDERKTHERFLEGQHFD